MFMSSCSISSSVSILSISITSSSRFSVFGELCITISPLLTCSTAAAMRASIFRALVLFFGTCESNVLCHSNCKSITGIVPGAIFRPFTSKFGTSAANFQPKPFWQPLFWDAWLSFESCLHYQGSTFLTDSLINLFISGRYFMNSLVLLHL